MTQEWRGDTGAVGNFHLRTEHWKANTFRCGVLVVKKQEAKREGQLGDGHNIPWETQRRPGRKVLSARVKAHHKKRSWDVLLTTCGERERGGYVDPIERDGVTAGVGAEPGR